MRKVFWSLIGSCCCSCCCGTASRLLPLNFLFKREKKSLVSSRAVDYPYSTSKTVQEKKPRDVTTLHQATAEGLDKKRDSMRLRAERGEGTSAQAQAAFYSRRNSIPSLHGSLYAHFPHDQSRSNLDTRLDRGFSCSCSYGQARDE